MKIFLAMDIGGTNIKYGLVTPAGELLKRSSIPTLSEEGPERVAERVADAFSEMVKSHPGVEPLALSVTAPGVIRPAEGVLVMAPNLTGWPENVPFAGILEKRLKVPTKLANDGDMFALGEWLAGAGAGLDSLVGIPIGTGVGGGIVLDGKLWQGCGASAAEFGHIVIVPDGRRCGCGSRGCLEQYASATGITKTARKAIRAGVQTGYNGRPEDLTAEELHHLADQGDQMALEAYATAGWAMGIGLTTVFNLLGVEGVVIGGGVAPAFDLIQPKLYEEFSSRVLAVEPEKVRIVPAALGNDAQLVAAAALLSDLQ